MSNILTIASREIRSAFVTPLAYVIIAGFLVLSGFFFFSLLQQFNSLIAQAAMMPDIHPSLNEWVVVPFYQTLEVVLIFLVPLLTMRVLAEERRSGTLELLATSPLKPAEIVAGKFLGVAAVVVVMLLLSFSFPLVLIIYADPEVPPVFIGFVGLVCYALGFVALGLAVSAFCRSQTVAGVISLVLLLVFYIIDAPAEQAGGVVQHVLEFLAPTKHTSQMVKGVLTGTDLVYFVSVVLVGLFAANRVLDAESWR